MRSQPIGLSRIEAGEIITPTADTVQKLATGFGVSNDSLSEVAAANVENDASELRVGFAHCLWAAPVIPLAMEGPTPTGIELTSYGLYTAAELKYQPERDKSKQKGLIRVGPRLNNARTANGLPPSGYELWPEDTHLTTYSAPDLDRLLKRGEIDCVVAAKNVFDSHDKLLIRCARIMDCVGSGTALLVWEPEWEWAPAFAVTETSLLDLSKPLNEAAKVNKRGLRCFFPGGTNAEKSLDFLPQDLKDKLDRKSISLRNWKSVTESLRTALQDEHAFLFFCWEPFLSSARAMFHGQTRSVVAVHLSDRKPVPYLSFDLFFTREKAKDWFASTNVRHFLSRVAHNIDKIKEAIQSKNNEAPVIGQISSYLRMSPADCLRSLSEMDFGLLYYPDWLELSAWTQR